MNAGLGDTWTMIVCDCGWLAIAGSERRAWDDHKRGTRCKGGYRLLASPRIAGKHRARLCIHGHERDVLGVCWTCLTAKERLL